MSIRLKLTIWFVVVVLMANGLLSLTIILSLEATYLNEVQNRVRLDLNSARTLYEHQTGEIAALLRAVAVRRSITSPLTEEVRGGLGKVLQRIRREGEPDRGVRLIDVAVGHHADRVVRPACAWRRKLAPVLT